MNLDRAEGVPDYVLLEELTENAVYDNLALRFGREKIYTFIGDVVISVNPFKKLNIYNPSDIANYRGRYKYERDPHIFALANDAYRNMTSNKQDQCIIISGESGAGKTEASKIIMQYITAVSKSSKTAEAITQSLLESNPVLEAFGNAKTLRNDNSSRFGKYMTMQFSVTGAPIGGQITNYLLEKSRVVTRFKGERSFHVFYQMLAGLSPQKKGELKLGDIKSYNYLNMSECFDVPSIDDAKDFAAVVKAMGILGIKQTSVDAIWKILAGILHLGNITFEKKGNTVNVTSKEALSKAALCLGVKEPALVKALTYRSISVDQQKQPNANKSSEQIFVPYDQNEAVYSRDALAKALYDRLFTWLVQAINTSIQSNANRRDYHVIGILDIYGFEIFDMNSFEQLNINYCNEKLQQLFIELTLKSEQEEYVREGIEWTQIDYFNNKTICDLIEKKPLGIISLMDEEVLMGGGTDASFLTKLAQHFGNHPHFQSAQTLKDRNLTNNNFRLKHYAGDVTYDVRGVLDKNKDTLFNDLIELIVGGNLPLLQELFAPLRKVDSKKRPETAGAQFRTAINALIQNLLACTPHYVRCIKPNDDKRAGFLDETRVRHQIRYLGLLENVRVQRAGFANRQEFTRFYQRYKMLSKGTWPNFRGDARKDPKGPVNLILKENAIEDIEYRLGKTKIFIRNPTTLFYFEEQRIATMPKIATLIQKMWRGYKARCFFEKLKATITLQSYYRLKVTRKWYIRTQSAIMIQKHYRGYKDRREWVRRKSATKIQLWYRWAKCGRWTMDMQDLFRDVKRDPVYGKYFKWPPHAAVLNRGVGFIKEIHLRWRVRTMLKSLNAQQTAVMKEKIRGYDIFHSNKPWSHARQFEHNYLPKTPGISLPKLEKVLNELPGSKTILFASNGQRVNSKEGLDKGAIVVTESHIHKLKAKSYQLKGSIAMDQIVSIGVNSMDEYTVLIKIKQPSKENDWVWNLMDNASGTETMTELVTVLYSHLKHLNGAFPPVTFSNTLKYFNKKEHNLSFQESTKGKFECKKSKLEVLFLFPAQKSISVK